MVLCVKNLATLYGLLYCLKINKQAQQRILCKYATNWHTIVGPSIYLLIYTFYSYLIIIILAHRDFRLNRECERTTPFGTALLCDTDINLYVASATVIASRITTRFGGAAEAGVWCSQQLCRRFLFDRQLFRRPQRQPQAEDTCGSAL